MRGFIAMTVLVLGIAGCASIDSLFDSLFNGAAASLLARADRLADRQQYEPALRTYDEFLARYPSDPAAPRAQKSRDTLASILTARAELARLRSELAARDGELARLRQETERLRADLEKLKEVDLNLERKKR
jgi:hypothetical protein